MITRTLWAAVMASTVVACAQTAEPAPAPGPERARRGLDCPPPTSTISLGAESTGVRIRNDSGQDLLIFLDECTGHRRLGTVQPSRARLFGLPGSVFLQGSQLVLHSFTQDPDAFHSSHRHRPGPDTVYIEATDAVATTVNGATGILEVGEGLFQVEPHPDGPRITLSDNQGRTTLRLSCSNTQPVVEIGGLTVERGPIDAVLLFGSGERAPTNPWSVTDEGWIRSPATFAEPIISRLRINTSVEFQFQTPSFYVTMTFNTTAMDEAISVLSCAGP